jgi:hypothetical protein
LNGFNFSKVPSFTLVELCHSPTCWDVVNMLRALFFFLYFYLPLPPMKENSGKVVFFSIEYGELPRHISPPFLNWLSPYLRFCMTPLLQTSHLEPAPLPFIVVLLRLPVSLTVPLSVGMTPTSGHSAHSPAHWHWTICLTPTWSRQLLCIVYRLHGLSVSFRLRKLSWWKSGVEYASGSLF